MTMNSKTYPEYNMGGGVTIKPRLELDGTVRAGPDWDEEPCEVKVFDVFQHGKLKASGVETWEEAREIALTLRTGYRSPSTVTTPTS